MKYFLFAALVQAVLAPGNVGACELQVMARSDLSTTGLWYEVAVGSERWRGPVPPGGAFQLDGLPCSAVEIEVGDLVGVPGFESVEPLVKTTAAVTPWARQTIDVSIPAVPTTLFEAATEAGEPVRGAWVSIVSEDKGGFVRFLPLVEGTAAAHLQPGAYLAALHLPARIPLVSVMLDGLPVDSPVRFRVDGRARKIRFVVENRVTLRGSVRGPESFDPSGVLIGASTEDGTWSCDPCAMADARGTFSLLVPSLPVRLLAHDPSGTVRFVPESLEVASLEDEIQFEGTPVENFLVGRVVAERGDPVSQARVFILADGHGYNVRTSGDGFFRTPCEDGARMSIEVSAADQGYLGAKWNSPSASCSEPIVIRLPAGAVIEGTVRDQSGLVVDAVRLFAVDRRGNIAPAVTGGGRFRFSGLRAGNYTIVVDPRAPEAYQAVGLRQGGHGEVVPRVSVSPGEKKWVELVLHEGGKACVEVVDTEGRRLKPRRLELYLPDSDEADYVFTQQVGRSELCSGAVPPNKYLLRFGEEGGPVRLRWWPGESARQRAEAVRIRPGETRRLGPVILKPCGAILLKVPLAAPEEFPFVELGEALEDPEQEGEVVWSYVEKDRLLELNSRRGRELHILDVPPGTWFVRACEVPTCETGEWTAGPARVEEYARVRAELRRASE